MAKTPRILIWDVETSTMDILHRTYSLKIYKRYHDHKDIVRDWIMLGAAWKWLDEDEVGCISVTPSDSLNDRGVITHLHSVLSQADMLVGHNSDNFDIKKFNTRALYYGLPPVPKVKSVDTLKVARKYFKLSSNTLSYIADFLGADAKDESPDWDKCLEGDADELRYMRKYNKQDVLVTEQVYKKLRGWHDTHPNLNVMHETRDSKGYHVDLCKVCGSPNIVKNGKSYTNAGVRQRYACRDCGGTSYGKYTKRVGGLK